MTTRILQKKGSSLLSFPCPSPPDNPCSLQAPLSSGTLTAAPTRPSGRRRACPPSSPASCDRSHRLPPCPSLHPLPSSFTLPLCPPLCPPCTRHPHLVTHVKSCTLLRGGPQLTAATHGTGRRQRCFGGSRTTTWTRSRTSSTQTASRASSCSPSPPLPSRSLAPHPLPALRRF
jgi:hypothetical protein